MDESSNSSLGSSSGTPPTGNGVPGGGDSGFHPQQMHQQFSATYRPGKFQAPIGLHQAQRPIMISYDQNAVIGQQQGSYMHHGGPYQQLLHQQQQQLQFQQQQQQQQQIHQQIQIQFPQQQPENLQRSMPYIQDTQKSSSSQAENLKSSNMDTSNKVSIKPDSSTDGGVAKQTTQTPAEVEKLQKALEEQRAAHEKQVRDLQAMIASLQEQKKEKEVKYLRVPGGSSSGPQKITQEETMETLPPRKSTRSKAAVNNAEDMDTGGDTWDVMDSCPSPVPSIKSEPDDDEEYEKWAKKGYKYTEEGDSKVNLKKGTAVRPKEEHPKISTLSVTDFDLCIFCQVAHTDKLSHVTEQNFPSIYCIILNVDCEPSHRLKDYVLDEEMFMNNIPLLHQRCHNKLKSKLKTFRIKRKQSGITDLSLCIFCQEHKHEPLSKITKKGFSGFIDSFTTLDNETNEKLNKIFNLERIQGVLKTESAKEDFSPDKLKAHKWCRQNFNRHNSYRSKKARYMEIAKRENNPDEYNQEENTEVTPVEEENVEITPNEEVLELITKRKKKLEEQKLRKKLPEPEDFNYVRKCPLCGCQAQPKNKVRSIKDESLEKIKANAIEKQHTDVVKLLDYAVDSGIDLLVHTTCYGNYIYKSTARVKKGTYECYAKAFKPIAAEIEDLIFRQGKVICVTEFKDRYIKNLLEEFDVQGDDKISLFILRIKNNYTFGKKCYVNVLSYPYYFIYSNHLRESQFAPQIEELKKERENRLNENCPYLEPVPDDPSGVNDSTESGLKKKKKWKFKCIECGYKCLKKSNFNKHLKKHEYKSVEEIVIAKQAMCDLCGKILKNSTSLKNHMRVHSGKKYPCPHPGCSKSYFAEGSLNLHLVTHTDKDEECPECGKMFFGKVHLNKHIKAIHGDGQFLCSICGKSYRTKDRLKEHARRHSDVRPYICKDCGKSFKYSSNLRTHELAHDGKKPYMCPICSFGAYTKANLNVHMAVHTKKSDQMLNTRKEQVNEYDPEFKKYIHLYDDIPNLKAQFPFNL